jgi:hypothetical protein
LKTTTGFSPRAGGFLSRTGLKIGSSRKKGVFKGWKIVVSRAKSGMSRRKTAFECDCNRLIAKSGRLKAIFGRLISFVHGTSPSPTLTCFHSFMQKNTIHIPFFFLFLTSISFSTFAIRGSPIAILHSTQLL